MGNRMKIAINTCYGGFGVSRKVFNELGIEWDGYGSLGNKSFGIEDENYLAWRANRTLIAAIEKVGCKAASGDLAGIEIVDIPDGVEWTINNYDGIESIHEALRSWYWGDR